MEGIAPVAALPGFRLTVCRPQRKRRAPMTFAIRNLDHVVVCVSDLERALKFYTEVLGCREERRVERIGLVQLSAGASMIDLLRVNPGPAGSEKVPPTRQLDHFAIRTEPFSPPAPPHHLGAPGNTTRP